MATSGEFPNKLDASIIGSIRDAHKTDVESAVDADLVDKLKDRIEDTKGSKSSGEKGEKEIDIPQFFNMF